MHLPFWHTFGVNGIRLDQLNRKLPGVDLPQADVVRWAVAERRISIGELFTSEITGLVVSNLLIPCIKIPVSRPR